MKNSPFSDMYSASCRLSPSLQEALQEQAHMEAKSSAQYLAMASWCDAQGYTGAAGFLYKQSDEERGHMLKIMHYINDAGGHAKQPALAPSQHDFSSLKDVFSQALAQEMAVTAAIHNLVDQCLKNQAYTTFHFLQWFLEEQQEEEVWARKVMAFFDVIGKGELADYFVDQEIGRLST